MKLKFTCKNATKHKIICSIDNRKLKCKTINNSAQANVWIDAGTHTLTVTKRIFYDSILCYLNILNPIFYFFQLRFLGRKYLGYDESFASVKLSFSTKNQNDATIELNLDRKEIFDPSGQFYCISKMNTSGIENVCFQQLSMNKKYINRFKLIRIASALLYMLFFDILCAFEYISGNENFLESLIFCCLISAFSINIVWRTIKIKSVRDTINHCN